MPELKDYAIGTLTIALLVSLGFAVAPDDNFFCRDSGEAKYCDRLSSTGLTCYPAPATAIGKKYCSTGWEKITVQEMPSFDVLGGVKVWNCPVELPCRQIQ